MTRHLLRRLVAAVAALPLSLAGLPPVYALRAGLEGTVESELQRQLDPPSIATDASGVIPSKQARKMLDELFPDDRPIIWAFQSTVSADPQSITTVRVTDPMDYVWQFDQPVGSPSIGSSRLTPTGADGVRITKLELDALANSATRITRTSDPWIHRQPPWLQHAPAAGMEEGRPLEVAAGPAVEFPVMIGQRFSPQDFQEQFPEFVQQHGRVGQALLESAGAVVVQRLDQPAIVYRAETLAWDLDALRVNDPAADLLRERLVVQGIPASADALQAPGIVLVPDRALAPSGEIRIPLLEVSNGVLPTLTQLYVAAVTGDWTLARLPAAQVVTFTSGGLEEQRYVAAFV